eukprot:PhM_4_TR11589/c0_g1_i1/m.81984
MTHWTSSAVSSRYAVFRPQYPAELFRVVAEATGASRNLCVDIGCGPGQATLALAPYFKKVLGVDPSATQIESAAKSNQLAGSMRAGNVDFVVGEAADFKMPNESVDCITVAQALHWFDAGSFARKAYDWLRPGGVLCIMMYGLPILENPNADKVFLDFYNMLVQEKHWAPERRHIETKYEKLLPRIGDTFCRASEPIHKEWSVEKHGDIDGILNYISTWSGYLHYVENTNDKDVLTTLRQRFVEAVGGDVRAKEDPLIMKTTFSLWVFRRTQASEMFRARTMTHPFSNPNSNL